MIACHPARKQNKRGSREEEGRSRFEINSIVWMPTEADNDVAAVLRRIDKALKHSLHGQAVLLIERSMKSHRVMGRHLSFE